MNMHEYDAIMRHSCTKNRIWRVLQ